MGCRHRDPGPEAGRLPMTVCSGPPPSPKAIPTQGTPAGLAERLSQVLGPELRASRCWRRASSSEPRLGRTGSNKLPSSTTRLRRSRSWVTLQHRETSAICYGVRAGVAGSQAMGRAHLRGVGILQEAKLITLAVRAKRLHDRQDAGRCQGCCRVESWWGEEWGRRRPRERCEDSREGGRRSFRQTRTGAQRT